MFKKILLGSALALVGGGLVLGTSSISYVKTGYHSIRDSIKEQIPIEVVAKGSAPQWVYVEVQGQSVPEPGAVSLLSMASLLLLRRRRDSGK